MNNFKAEGENVIGTPNGIGSGWFNHVKSQFQILISSYRFLRRISASTSSQKSIFLGKICSGTPPKLMVTRHNQVSIGSIGLLDQFSPANQSPAISSSKKDCPKELWPRNFAAGPADRTSMFHINWGYPRDHPMHKW